MGMGHLEKAIKGSAYVTAFAFLSGFIAYFVRVFLARTLTPYDYGLFYAIFTFVAFFFAFADLGTLNALVKFVSDFIAKKDFMNVARTIKIIATIVFACSGTLAILIIAFSQYLAESYFQDPSARIILISFAAYVIFRTTGTLIRNLLKSHQKFLAFSLLEPLKNTLIFVLLVIGVYFFKGAALPTFAYIFSWIITDLVFGIYLLNRQRKSSKFSIKKKSPLFKKIMTFAIPVLFFSMGARIISYLDTLILTKITTLEQVGIYNVVLPSALVLATVSVGIISVMFPMTAKLFAKKEFKKILSGIEIAYKYSWLIFLPIVLSLILSAKEFIVFFFGDFYGSGEIAFMILLGGVFIFMFANLNFAVLNGIGKPKVSMYSYLVALVVNVVLNLILIPKYGFVGAAIATAVSYLVLFIMSFTFVRKYLGKWSNQSILRGSIPVIAFGLCFFGIFQLLDATNFIYLINYIIAAIISGAIYYGLLLLFKALSREETKRLINKLFRKTSKNESN
jgi:O-antigen/teichoic acid export membrane protein